MTYVVFDEFFTFFFFFLSIPLRPTDKRVTTYRIIIYYNGTYLYNTNVYLYFFSGPYMYDYYLLYIGYYFEGERGSGEQHGIHILYKYIFAAILSSRARAFTTRGRCLGTICPEQLASDIMADDVYLLYAYYYIGNNVYLRVYEYNLYEMKRKKGYVCKNK